MTSLLYKLQVSRELLQKYLDLEKNFFLKFFLRFAGKPIGTARSASCPGFGRT